MRRVALAVAVLVLGSLGAVTALAETSATTVNVKLKEFVIAPSVRQAASGKVTFVVKNVGKINHEMVVMKTNVPPGKLPQNASHRVPEKGVVGEVGDVHPGQTKKATITLKPGKYVLLCNIAGHYKAGQYSGFVVR
jgi:uncharacterized cupredoxin-like copper-binding protein